MKWNTELYNSKHSFVYEFGSQVLDLLNPQFGEKILDLGCGSGQLTNQIKERGANVIGIDNSKEMIAAAKANFPDIDFRVMDAADFSFDFEFEAIFSNAAFHWFENPEKAVESMYRNLKSGGRIVMEFGGKDNILSIYKAVKTLLAGKGYLFKDFWYFPSIGEFTSLLEKKGFTVNFAHYFARDTELSGNENAIVDWIEMFGEKFFREVSPEDKSQILDKAKEILRPTNYINGRWIADYKRIRVIAEK